MTPPDDEEAVLFANRGFYRALETRNLEAMTKCWLQTEETACTHPGWHRLDGWEEISRSWLAIFRSSRPWKVAAREERVFVSGELAAVLCVEVLESAGGGPAARMQATNLFRKSEGAWKMIHHHASATTVVGDEEPDTIN